MSIAATTLTASYNDLEAVRSVFEANKGEIAGVILEPAVGNSGFIPPTQEFLEVCFLIHHVDRNAHHTQCQSSTARMCFAL